MLGCFYDKWWKQMVIMEIIFPHDEYYKQLRISSWDGSMATPALAHSLEKRWFLSHT